MSWVLIGEMAAIGYGLIEAERWNQRRLDRARRAQYRYIRLLPHINTVSDGAKISRLIDQLAGFNRTMADRITKGREWIRFLVYKDKWGTLAFYIGYPEDRTTGIHTALRMLYPDAELHPIPHELVPLPFGEGYHGYFDLKQKGDMAGLPLHSFDTARDEYGEILQSLQAGEKGTEIWLDVMFSTTSLLHLKRQVKQTLEAIHPKNGKADNAWKAEMSDFGQQMVEELKGRGQTGKKTSKPPKKEDKSAPVSSLDQDQQEKLRALRKRYTGREAAFDVALALSVQGKDAGGIAQTAASTITSVMRYDNDLHFVRTKKPFSATIAPNPQSRHTMLWTGDELANLVHLPDGKHRVFKYIPHLEQGQRSLGPNELNQGIAIGELKHPIQSGRKIYIPYEQWTKHGVLTGMTGMGKSSTATMATRSMCDEWIANPNAPGFSYIDPARETVASILSYLLKKELEGEKVDWSRVHYVYLGPTEYPIGLNLLYNSGGEESNEIVDDVLGLMKYAYGGDTPQMDRLVRNALMTLVEDPEPHTILGIVPLLQDEAFRKRILPRVKDPIVQAFWKSEFAALESKMGQAVSPILNRLSPFTTNKTMRRMFGQKNWALQLKKYMDEGHIFLWDVLNVKKQSIKLTVGHLLNQYHYTAKTRRSGSKPHPLLVDEAHEVQLPVMSKIIAEDRKFGLCLFLITQYVGQFEPWLIDAITENVGTILTCAQGPKSARAVSEMTNGNFSKDFLMGLAERMVAVYTREKDDTGRSSVKTLTIESDPPYIWRADGQIANHKDEAEMESAVKWAIAKGIELQKRDGKHYLDVDREIAEYLKTGTALEDDPFPAEQEEEENVGHVPFVPRTPRPPTGIRWEED